MKENDILHILNNLEQFGLPKSIMEIIDKLQQEAFMDGYRYAISMLEESMPGKDGYAGNPDCN